MTPASPAPPPATAAGPDAPTGQPVDDALAQRLWLAAAVPSGRYLALMALVRDDAGWRRWGGRVILALAVGQLLAAVIFFIAFNWQTLPGLIKLGGALALVTLCALTALAAPGALVRQTLLVAAALLTGGALAVFGQHYQSGADTWQMFALWAALILPWTALAGGPVLWLVWGGVAQTGLVLALGVAALETTEAVLAVLPGLFVLARALRPARVPGWLATVAMIAALLPLGWLLYSELKPYGRSDGLPWGMIGLAAFAIFSWAQPWRRRRDLAPLAMTVCTVCAALSGAVMARVEALPDVLWALLLVTALFASAVAGLNWLRRWR